MCPDAAKGDKNGKGDGKEGRGKGNGPPTGGDSHRTNPGGKADPGTLSQLVAILAIGLAAKGGIDLVFETVERWMARGWGPEEGQEEPEARAAREMAWKNVKEMKEVEEVMWACLEGKRMECLMALAGATAAARLLETHRSGQHPQHDGQTSTTEESAVQTPDKVVAGGGEPTHEAGQTQRTQKK
jgi:hypothetical protein